MKRIVTKLHIFIVTLFIVGLFSHAYHDMQPLHDSSSCSVCSLSQLDVSSDAVLTATPIEQITFTPPTHISSTFTTPFIQTYSARAPPLFPNL